MTQTNLRTGALSGDRVVTARKVVGDLVGYWSDPSVIVDAGALLYDTQTFVSADHGDGVVLWGNTTLMPGQVGGEYFMTRGHRHLKPTHGELCITVSGSGLLLLMDRERACTTQAMSPGSTHWIDGRLAHRTINTGVEPLVFFCAWPADCGHDYDEISQRGFSVRVFEQDGDYQIVSEAIAANGAP